MGATVGTVVVTVVVLLILVGRVDGTRRSQLCHGETRWLDVAQISQTLLLQRVATVHLARVDSGRDLFLVVLSSAVVACRVVGDSGHDEGSCSQKPHGETGNSPIRHHCAGVTAAGGRRRGGRSCGHDRRGDTETRVLAEVGDINPELTSHDSPSNEIPAWRRHTLYQREHLTRTNTRPAGQWNRDLHRCREDNAVGFEIENDRGEGKNGVDLSGCERPNGGGRINVEHNRRVDGGRSSRNVEANGTRWNSETERCSLTRRQDAACCS
mmetsp:Transcript_28815/g.62230  ORF Transcript_28815/g.62230 Transcript_28815/m.62230 type:complete len:268 (+) Transcript_28815:234-1037(+)